MAEQQWKLVQFGTVLLAMLGLCDLEQRNSFLGFSFPACEILGLMQSFNSTYCHFWGVQGIKPRALHRLIICCTTKLQPQGPVSFFKICGGLAGFQALC
jgi:hypothetical protein